MLDPAALAAYGLPGLFAGAFLAGSVVPFPSEGLLILLQHQGVGVLPLVVVATLGNTAGALTLYGMGRAVARGSRGRVAAWLRKRMDKDEASLERGRRRVVRWGAPVLLLSWVPLLGDALVLAAGLLGVRVAPTAIYLTVGKALRFAALALATAALLGSSGGV